MWPGSLSRGVSLLVSFGCPCGVLVSSPASVTRCVSVWLLSVWPFIYPLTTRLTVSMCVTHASTQAHEQRYTHNDTCMLTYLYIGKHAFTHTQHTHTHTHTHTHAHNHCQNLQTFTQIRYLETCSFVAQFWCYWVSFWHYHELFERRPFIYRK